MATITFYPNQGTNSCVSSLRRWDVYKQKLKLSFFDGDRQKRHYVASLLKVLVVYQNQKISQEWLDGFSGSVRADEKCKKVGSQNETIFMGNNQSEEIFSHELSNLIARIKSQQAAIFGMIVGNDPHIINNNEFVVGIYKETENRYYTILAEKYFTVNRFTHEELMSCIMEEYPKKLHLVSPEFRLIHDLDEANCSIL